MVHEGLKDFIGRARTDYVSRKNRVFLYVLVGNVSSFHVLFGKIRIFVVSVFVILDALRTRVINNVR